MARMTVSAGNESGVESKRSLVVGLLRVSKSASGRQFSHGSRTGLFHVLYQGSGDNRFLRHSVG
jgi:hypothetical protein